MSDLLSTHSHPLTTFSVTYYLNGHLQKKYLSFLFRGLGIGKKAALKMLGIFIVEHESGPNSNKLTYQEEESTLSNNYRDGGEVTTTEKAIVDKADNDYDDGGKEGIQTTEKGVVDGAHHDYGNGEDGTTTLKGVVAEADNDHDDQYGEDVTTTEKDIVDEADNDYDDGGKEGIKTTEKDVVDGAHHGQDQSVDETHADVAIAHLDKENDQVHTVGKGFG